MEYCITSFYFMLSSIDASNKNNGVKEDTKENTM